MVRGRRSFVALRKSLVFSFVRDCLCKLFIYRSHDDFASALCPTFVLYSIMYGYFKISSVLCHIVFVTSFLFFFFLFFFVKFVNPKRVPAVSMSYLASYIDSIPQVDWPYITGDMLIKITINNNTRITMNFVSQQNILKMTITPLWPISISNGW